MALTTTTTGTCSAIVRVVGQDACGNTSAPLDFPTRIDAVPPELHGVPGDTTVECSAVPAPSTDVTATDDCDPAPALAVRDARFDGACLDTYTIRRTWTATDSCGNHTSGSQLIHVRDTTTPTLAGVPPSTSASCDSIPPPAGSVTATDNCDPTPAITFAETRTDGACPDSYVLHRTWTATDRCGKLSSSTQDITVTDTTAPTLAGIPPDATYDCPTTPPVPSGITATDNCDPAPHIAFSEVREDGTCPGTYVLHRTWTATDRCSNASSRSQTVTVRDTTPPVLSGVPADTEVECSSVPTPATPSATDACDPAPSVTYSQERVEGSCPDTYTLRRTWIGTDHCGNASAGSTQVITVHDRIPPTLTGVPADATVECSSVPPPATPTAADNCDPAPRLTFNELRTEGHCADTYTLTRTWVATDRCGNSTRRQQLVHVSDVQPPTLMGVPADATVECSAVPPPATPTAADNCDPAPVVTFNELRTEGRCADTYTLTRTWVATDRCDNSTRRQQILHVIDIQAPALLGVPPDATVECDAVPAPAAVTAVDGCDPNPLLRFTETRTNGPCSSTYRLTRTWQTTDRCGNAASRQQVLNVVDTHGPVVRQGSNDLYCLWPANHHYNWFQKSQFHPSMTDNCTTGPFTWKFVGCPSNQPDDAPGGTDGETVNDCVVSNDGSAFAVRSEADSHQPGGRRYQVVVRATDACGNQGPPERIGYVYVPVQGGSHLGCLRPNG